MSTFTPLTLGVAALVFSGALYAADNASATNRKVSLVPVANPATAPLGQTEVPVSAALGEPLIFSAPPRESAEEAARIYRPVADYLARTLGRPVAYKYPGNWLTYQKEMAKGSYDVAFDGPHFNSWRISRLNHNTLAKIADEHAFAVITRKDNMQITGLKQLAGKKICAMSSPNLGTLALLAEFDPMRQPLVMDSLSWTKVYEGVMEGRCAAGTLPVAMLRKLDGAGSFARVIHQSRQLPNQAFSAGPRLTSEEQIRLTQALLSPAGKQALDKLLAVYGSEKGLAFASKDEYAGLDAYLKDVWGYR